jgi:hypothetical protein
MRKLLIPALVLGGLLALSASGQAQQQPGVVGAPPPEDLFLEVSRGPAGQPILSTDEFTMALGGYYRFNFTCVDEVDDTTGFHFEAPDLIANSHLRVYSVGDIELYIQGLSFHAIECDEKGGARFSFHPMRRGVYDLYVRDHSDPPQEAFGRFIVE